MKLGVGIVSGQNAFPIQGKIQFTNQYQKKKREITGLQIAQS